MNTFVVSVLYNFFYFVLCERGKIKKAGIPRSVLLSVFFSQYKVYMIGFVNAVNELL